MNRFEFSNLGVVVQTERIDFLQETEIRIIPLSLNNTLFEFATMLRHILCRLVDNTYHIIPCIYLV